VPLLERTDVIELAQGFDANGEVGHLSADLGNGWSGLPRTADFLDVADSRGQMGLLELA
jgi:hypothetical protein